MAAMVVEPCTTQALPELFEKFADWYRFNPRLRERNFFDWQFKNAPTRLSDDEYDFLILRNDQGAITGCLGFAGFEFKCDGRLQTGAWTHNWYAQEQREGGLALLLRFFEIVDNRFMLRFNRNAARVFALLKIPMRAAVPRWWAVTDVNIATDLFRPDAEQRAAFARSADAMAQAEAAGDVTAVTRFNPADEFTLAHLGDGIRLPRRTGGYLNWRYFDIPRHRYRAIRSEQGFAVYRVEAVMGTDHNVLRILEWTFGKESDSALALIRSETAAEKPLFLDFSCTCPRAARALEKSGFVRDGETTKPLPDLFRPLNYSGGYALGIDLPPHRTTRAVDFASWYITTGDSDVDRVKL